MKPIQAIYPDLIKEYEEDNYFYAPSDYTPLLKSFDCELLIQVDDQDYQGDSRVLYKDNDRIGLLIFGWGSCSGCDALQACNSPEDIEKLQKELSHSIKWFDNKNEALHYFETHDWEGDYCWYAQETKDFVEKCVTYLGG